MEEIVVRKGGTVIIRAKNIKHAILIFDKKFNYELEWALQHEDYTLTKEAGQ
jgi:hypothetical protein